MKILDPGHDYLLDSYDGGNHEHITFMKRHGDNFPGNVGSYPGTNCQEVIRVLIDRVKYLDNQISCHENKLTLMHLRSALLEFEVRAANRHKIPLRVTHVQKKEPELIPVCKICGHWVGLSCKGHQ
jgi:hypothetical protein